MIVAVTALVVALELGILVGVGAINLSPLRLEPAYAQAPAVNLDCDNDKDAGTDKGEMNECYPLTSDDLLDIAEKGLIGLAIGAGVILAIEGVALLGPSAALLAAQGGTGAGLSLLIGGSTWSANVAAGLGAGLLYGGMAGIGALLALLQDPPDHSKSVALPPSISLGASPFRAGACRRSPRAAACRTVVSAAGRYVAAAQVTTRALTAFAITANRFQTSKNTGAQRGQVLHAATGKLYMHQVADAIVAQENAGGALATALKRAHLNVHLSAAQVARVAANLRSLHGVPGPVVRRLTRILGVSQAALKTLIRRALKSGLSGQHGFDLAAALNRRVDLGPLIAGYESLSPGEVGALVDNLAVDRGISADAAITLDDDLLGVEQTCNASQRQGRVDQYLNDVHAKVPGPYATLLADAAEPMRANHPYPDNKPPVAAFHAGVTDGKASPGHPLHDIFRDESTDPNDRGHIACWQWNFGDPGSGTANTSTDQSPTHDYASAGTYTVTLKAIDDDGFAASTATTQVTVHNG
jgi:hypothetical protein